MVRWLRALVSFGVLLCSPLYSNAEEHQFHEGCCLNKEAFPRPAKASKGSVPDATLFKALNCATSSRLVGNAVDLAKHFGTRSELLVAYYYGTYMPEQSGPALTIAIYSRDQSSGILLDVAFEEDEYAIDNLPLLKKYGKLWRVGEINGGLWSYTRLYYLAQEIGARSTRQISLDDITRHRASKCSVLYEKIY